MPKAFWETSWITIKRNALYSNCPGKHPVCLSPGFPLFSARSQAVHADFLPLSLSLVIRRLSPYEVSLTDLTYLDVSCLMTVGVKLMGMGKKTGWGGLGEMLLHNLAQNVSGGRSLWGRSIWPNQHSAWKFSMKSLYAHDIVQTP